MFSVRCYEITGQVTEWWNMLHQNLLGWGQFAVKSYQDFKNGVCSQCSLLPGVNGLVQE